ncbi:MAG: endopeptidase La, partial [Deltaproteobacteria bacterium]|nr:endopeptidase La [Deltaproteobacteria bacterium]
LRADVHKVIIPEKNKKDLAEIPLNVKRKLTFLPVSHLDEVLKIALRKKSVRKRTRKAR